MAKQQTQEAAKKPKRISLLEIRKVDTKNGKKAVVQFAKDIEITWKGQALDLGEYRSIFVKQTDELVKDLDFLLENNHIDQDTYESRLARLEEKQVTAAVQAPLK